VNQHARETPNNSATDNLVQCPGCGELNKIGEGCETCWLIGQHDERETAGT